MGFTTRLDRKSDRYTGLILIHDKQAWRLKGEIASFAKTSSNPPTGTVGGTGSLYRWQEVMPGTFDYVLVDASVSFKVTFTDTSSARNGKPSTPDSFTLNWIGNYAGGAVSPLVTGSAFQPLKGGNITVR